MKRGLFVCIALFLVAGLILSCAPKPAVPPAPPKEPYIITLGAYRTGPFMHGGMVFANGFSDYGTLIAAKGGIDGWPVTFMEIETGYETPRIVEAYERGKAAGNMVTFIPLSTGGAYAVTPKAFKDKIPILQTGYGISAAAYGSGFPWVFLGTPTYWGIEANTTKWILDQEGGDLRGKKIAIFYLDIDYGRETIPIMKDLSDKLGFKLLLYPIPWPGLEQSAVWSKIAEVDKPDWIIWRLWGLSTPTAIKEAARVKYPMKRIVGCPWSPMDQDIVLAGPHLAVGIRANYWTASGTDFPVIKEILTEVYDKGKGFGPRADVGTQLYNRGVYNGILAVTAIRLAAAKFGHPVKAEQVRWGYEQITPEVLAKGGAGDMLPPVTITATDHAGGFKTMMHEFDGKRMVPISGWISAYEDIVLAKIEKMAKEFMAKYPELYK